jgi:hypothetical protein
VRLIGFPPGESPQLAKGRPGPPQCLGCGPPGARGVVLAPDRAAEPPERALQQAGRGLSGQVLEK